GEPIYPVEEIRVPASPLREEPAWPTQVLPKKPLPFTSQELNLDMLNKHSPDYDSLVQVFEQANKGIYMPFSQKPTLINPGLNGGGEWGGAAVDPEGVLYVNANEVPWVVTLQENTRRSGLSLGELTYLDNCSSCHGVEFNGNEVSGFPSLVDLETKFDNSEIK